MGDSITPYYDPILDKIRSIDNDADGGLTFDPYLEQLRAKDIGSGVKFDPLLNAVRQSTVAVSAPTILSASVELDEEGMAIFSGTIATGRLSTTVKIMWGETEEALINEIQAGTITEDGGITKSVDADTFPTGTIYWKMVATNSSGSDESNVQGALLNLSDETNAYILAVESEPDGFVDKKFATNTAINQSVENGAYSKIAFWTKKTEFGRNFFFKPMSSDKYLLKVDGTKLLIIETSNVNDVLELGCAVAKDYESDKIEIPLINQTISDGNNIDGWLGAGTVITRLFSNLARTITQTIKIDLYRIDITSIVTYNESVLVEYEGFEFKGAMWLNKHTNTFAGGTGDHIITQQGIYSHNGIYTPHVVLANINKNFMYKNYSEGDSATTQICFVDKNKYVPARILLQPDGYDATIVFSNHADNANVARQRAVHFGTSDTESPDYGAKGITGRGIKVDWSVFTQTFNSDYPGFFEDQDYIDFLLSIKASGSQIIPHALTGSGIVTKENRDIYLAAFKNLFGSSNWTDHGLGGGALNYGISSKGWDISDEVNYMLDSFENNGFKKAWNYIDTNQDLITDFLLGFPHDIVYCNDHLVMPSGTKLLLWKSSDRPFYYQWLNLQKLIDNCGVINAHDYIAEGSTRQTTSGDSLTGFDKTHWLDGDDFKITTGFDNILAAIAQKKTDGQVWNPTCTEQIDFINLLKNVVVEMTSVNKYKVTNNSGVSIQGFTFLICKTGISPKLNNFLMKKKASSLGTICWNDLPEGINYITF